MHTAAHWLMLSPARLGALRTRSGAMPVRHHPALPDQSRRPRKVALPNAFPHKASFADLAGRISKLPPEQRGGMPAQTLRCNLKPDYRVPDATNLRRILNRIAARRPR